MRQPESVLKSEILDWLNRQSDTFAFPVRTTGIPDGRGGFRKNPNKGVADIIGVKNGKAFAIEVKRDETARKNTPSHQIEFLQNFADAKGAAVIVDTIEDAKMFYLEV